MLKTLAVAATASLATFAFAATLIHNANEQPVPSGVVRIQNQSDVSPVTPSDTPTTATETPTDVATTATPTETQTTSEAPAQPVSEPTTSSATTTTTTTTKAAAPASESTPPGPTATPDAPGPLKTAEGGSKPDDGDNGLPCEVVDAVPGDGLGCR